MAHEAQSALGARPRSKRTGSQTAGPAATLRVSAADGSLLLLEVSHALPLVDVQLTLRTGSLHDPLGLEGLSRLTARMLRMGTRRLHSKEVDARVDALGAQLGVECGPSFTRVFGTTLKRNLEPFLSLLGQLIARPAFRAADLEKLQRETLAELIENCDNDRILASRHFRRQLFGSHLAGRSSVGTRASVAAIRREHIHEHYRRHYVASNLIVAFAGSVEPEHAVRLRDRYLSAFPARQAPAQKLAPTRTARGRRALIVDKPQRTQTQLLIGTLGVRARDRDATALTVANTAFGGTFTSRLTREVRSKRGWSYSASSGLGHEAYRDAWSMWTAPAASDAPGCARLQLRLLEKLLERGISQRELRFAQDYIAKSHAFDIDTAAKRLEEALDVELLGLPRNFTRTYIKRIRAVTREQANASLQKRLSADDLSIVLVATARELERKLAKLPGLTELRVVPFDVI